MCNPSCLYDLVRVLYACVPWRGIMDWRERFARLCEGVYCRLIAFTTGIGGVDDIFQEDLSKPPNFFSLVGQLGRGLFQ